MSGTVNGHNQTTSYHFEYGIDALDQRTPDMPLEPLNHLEQFTTARVDGLTAGATYKYRLVATNKTVTAAGPERSITVTLLTGSPYRSAVLTTPGVLGYWRLGESTGAVATSETGANPGTYSAQGVTLSQSGALSADPDTAAAFDGAAGEMSAPTTQLSTDGTLEGWFDWRSGTALMRDNTISSGWILAYDALDATRSMRTRIAGATYTTDLSGHPIPERLASLRRHEERLRRQVLRRRRATAPAPDVRGNLRPEQRPLARHAQRPHQQRIHARTRRRGRGLRHRPHARRHPAPLRAWAWEVSTRNAETTTGRMPVDLIHDSSRPSLTTCASSRSPGRLDAPRDPRARSRSAHGREQTGRDMSGRDHHRACRRGLRRKRRVRHRSGRMPLPSRNTTLAAVSLLLPLPRTDSATKECWVVVRTGNAECGERQQMPHGGGGARPPPPRRGAVRPGLWPGPPCRGLPVRRHEGLARTA